MTEVLRGGVRVLTLADLHLESGTCDVCRNESEYIVFVIIDSERGLGFYLCDGCRRDTIDGLASV